MKHKVLKPNVVRGGIAIPLGANYYYMSGRKHKDGGIDIGKNPRTGLEVEDGEVMHINKDNVKVFSSVPFLNGKSPAQKVMGGENPNKVFNQQEEFKDKYNMNDDGTKRSSRKAKHGGLYSITVNGRTKLRMYPFTGGLIQSDKMEFSGRKKARLGISNKQEDDITEYNNATKTKYKINTNNKNMNYGRDYSNPILTILNKLDESTSTTNNPYTYTGIAPNPAIRGKGIGRTGFNMGRNNNVTNKSIINNKSSKPIINNTNANVTNITNKSSVNKSSVNNNNINVMGVTNKHTNKKPINNTNRKNNILPKINIGRVEPIGITNTPMNVSKNIKNIPINYNYKSTDNTIPFRYKIKQYIKDNPQTVSDGLGLASNIIGGLITRRKNNRMLNKLKYSDAPIAAKADKLKTRININPQLDKMRESLSEYERNIDNSTSSSRVALARKQQARLANTLQTNELYGNKENTETELINKDKLNQQTVADANIREYNLWQEKKAAFNNAVLEKKAENDVSLFNTINSGIQDIISRGEKRNSERQTRLAMMAANPNVNPRILKGMGIKGITDEDVAAYDKTYGKKKKSKQIK